MSDNADAGTDNTGTQPTEVDQSTAPGTADAGTQTQPETDSQSHSGTENTTTSQQTVEGQAQAVPPTGEQKPANPWESTENPYFKRFNDTQSHVARLYQERQQLAKQNQDYQEKVSRFEKMQQESEAKAKMLPFQKSHPEYANTRERLGKVAAFRTALSSIDNADDNTMKKLAQNFGLTVDDFKMEQSEQAYRQKIGEELNADPEGFIQSRVENKITEALQKYDSYISSKVNVERRLNDPSNARLLDAYAPQMAQIMDPQVSSSDKAFQYAQLLAERDALKAKLGNRVEEVAHSEAQTAFSQPRQQGSQRRQGQAPQYPAEAERDAYAYAKKQNPDWSQDQLLTLAMKINASFR